MKPRKAEADVSHPSKKVADADGAQPKAWPNIADGESGASWHRQLVVNWVDVEQGQDASIPSHVAADKTAEVEPQARHPEEPRPV